MLVNSSGSKLFRFKYRFDGREKLLALGAYPSLSLEEARARREAAKALLGRGEDPNPIAPAISKAPLT